MLSGTLGGNEKASGIMGLVTNMLDANKDGNVVDDIMGMVGNFFGGKK